MDKETIAPLNISQSACIYEQIQAQIAARRSGLAAYQLAEYKAAKNWLRRYRPADESNLARVTGYLEAFYHLAQVEDWDNARAIATIQLPATHDQELHRQLFVWGYYRQQQRLYKSLFGQADAAMDLVCLSGLGNLEDVWGNIDRAIEYHRQALALAQMLESAEARSTALGSLGNAYLSLQNFEQAIDYYQQQLDLAEMLEQPRLVGVALGGLGNAYREIAAYNLALDVAKRRIDIAQSSGDQQGEGDGYCSLGSTYLAQGELTEALTVLEQALTIAQSIGYRLGECRALGNLGLVYGTLQKDDAAIDCLEKTLALANKIEDKEGRQQAILQLEVLYRQRGDTLQAMGYQQLARGFISEPLERAALLLNLGTGCRNLNRLETAIDCYQELLTVAELVGEDEQRLLRMMGLYCLALTYQQQDEIKQAWRSCRLALELSHTSVEPLVEKCLDLQQTLALALQREV
ncbi:tetratricopeptide repeat protein [Leptolyngbya cf. ectocarpi LEGE 11479]|uniref:Tetratricopeptide repeat protein n=1 Tax=Leptolyngbya cf. ectocarpi LEGE 11479 TaxID=1828722 RepID=A0A929F8I6_LEPEC|nr:tetratricopeptide repeat protein [Leptolyngbya ectocarpi]MBE9069320.1 tetratricopeptide repeat protein [Leptolyngbya cf. ectocarpi LEGE 11479]